MLIRSQDKKELVQMNKILIQVSGTEVICYDHIMYCRRRVCAFGKI